MNIDFDSLIKILPWVHKQWYSAWGMLAAIALATMTLIVYYGGKDISQISLANWLFITAINLGIGLVWWYQNKIEKCKKDHIGFAIAIDVKCPKEREIIVNDFIKVMRRLLDSHTTNNCRLMLLEVPQRYACKITSESAEKIMDRSRCHFLLWGEARLRSINGKQTHVLDLRGMVRHASISADVQKHFSEEFATLLPKQMFCPRENDVIHLENIGRLVACSSRYIIAVAAALSGDLDYSEQMFTEILNSDAKKIQFNPIVAKVIQMIPRRLAQLYQARASMAYYEWRKNKVQNNLDAIKNNLTIASRYDNTLSGILNLWAIYYFISSRDITMAFSTLRKCNDISNINIRYSMAFLFAYRGNLREARKIYRNALKSKLPTETFIEINIFIQDVLENEPDKIQLWFCIGWIFWKGLGDIVNAKKSFVKFIEYSSERKLFIDDMRVVESYCQEIRS